MSKQMKSTAVFSLLLILFACGAIGVALFNQKGRNSELATLGAARVSTTNPTVDAASEGNGGNVYQKLWNQTQEYLKNSPVNALVGDAPKDGAKQDSGEGLISKAASATTGVQQFVNRYFSSKVVDEFNKQTAAENVTAPRAPVPLVESAVEAGMSITHPLLPPKNAAEN